jgi:NADH-quinone oxidoreductase subunit E
MTVKSAQSWHADEALDATVEFGRVTAELLQKAPAMPVHPLLAHQAAAFAAATAFGFGLTREIAGAFFGALEGAMGVTGKFPAALEERQTAAVPQAVPAENVTVTPVAVAPAAKIDTNPVVAAPAAKVEAKLVVEAPAAKVEAKPVVAAPAAKVEANPVIAAPVAKVEAKPVVAKSSAPRAKRVAEAPAEIAAPKAVVVRTSPVAARKASAVADDLKRISGIGPKLEQVLNGRGVRRFADIVAWTPAEIARLDADLGFEGRIDRDDWVGQAKALAGSKE